jgi:hypothetical protein
VRHWGNPLPRFILPISTTACGETTMLLRLTLAATLLLMMSFPAIQAAVDLGISSRFGFFLFF